MTLIKVLNVKASRIASYYRKSGLLKTLQHIARSILLRMFYALSRRVYGFLPERFWICKYKKLLFDHTLIIDHALGGGANKYRDVLVKKMQGRSEKVAVLTSIIDNRKFMFFRLRCYDGDKSHEVSIYSVAVLLSLISKASYNQLIYNNLVYFPKIHEFLSMVQYKLNHSDIPFIIFVHDYFSMCASYTLVNSKGRYCDIPKYSECLKCQAGLDVTHLLNEPFNIIRWRKIWGELYQRAQEVICFSNSSKQIVQKAYQDIMPDKIKVTPHAMDYFKPANLPIYSSQEGLHIGIVGDISSEAKGQRIVYQLCDYILKTRQECKVTIVGNVSGAKLEGVTYTGAYQVDDLPKIFSTIGINVVLFPSIWPETFSYLVSELIVLNVPIVGFAYGAQGEKISCYKLGKISVSEEPEKLFETLRNHYLNLYK